MPDVREMRAQFNWYVLPDELPQVYSQWSLWWRASEWQFEVKPEMRCVWVEAWRGSQQMHDSQAIRQVQIPVDNLLKGSSSWLRVVRDKHAAHASESAQ